MALQSGLGLSKIFVIAGAGYAGTILLKNGKFSDVLGELQALVKGIEKSGDQADGDIDHAIAQQVRKLAMEIRQLASARQITVLNGGSGHMGNYTGLIIPAATVGTLGYGYMWWKGIKFSDLMYVTKRSMEIAVVNLTKHLGQVSEALSAAKTHLTQRIQLLDDKMDRQKEISKAIQNEVNAANENLTQIDSDLWQLQRLVTGLDGKIGTLEEKQDLANMGVMYLCQFVGGKKIKMPQALEDEVKLSRRSRAITFPDAPSPMGLKSLSEMIESGGLSRTASEPPLTDALQQGIIDAREDQPRTTEKPILVRFNSAIARC